MSQVQKSPRVFPEGKQYEFSLLAMMIRYPKNIDEVIMYGIDVDCFYNGKARTAFIATMSLHNRKQWIDSVTVTDEAKKLDQTIEFKHIEDLVNNKSEHSNNLEPYAKQLIDYKKQRKLLEEIKKAEDVVLSDLSTDDKFSTIQASISAIYNQKEDNRNFNEQEAFDGFIERLKVNMSNKGKNIITSGFEGYDAQVSLLPGVHVFAGIPGSGKTALLQQIIKHNAEQGKNAFVFSIEMNYDQLMMRHVQSALGIPVWKQHSGHLTDDELNQIIELKDTLSANVTYNDLGTIDINKLKSIAKVANSKRKVDIIAVDYLQKIKAKGFKEKHEEYAHIVQELSELGKELKVPVLCLAQLNREWKKNDSGIPEASNIAGSKMIEQEAVSICFIHRPGQIDKTHPNPEETFIYFAKNRFGNSNTVKMKFNGALCRFEEVSGPKSIPQSTSKPTHIKAVPKVVEEDDNIPFDNDEPLFDKSQKTEEWVDLFATPEELKRPPRVFKGFKK